MVILLVVFTLIDLIVTTVGLSVGCVELDKLVLAIGIGSWALFRVALLTYLAIVFLAGYWYCRKHELYKELGLLRICLFALNVYIGAVVFSGIIAILTKI